MYAFSDAIREFGIHSVRILPAKALFHVGSLEIMHAARFLPWGSSRGPCTVCVAAISLEYRVKHEYQVSMRVGRNVTIRRAWAPDKTGMSDGYGRQVGMDARQTWAPGRHGRRSKREHRSKRWLVSARLWASLLSGRLVEPHGFRLLGGVPEPHLWNCYRKLESGPPHLLLFRRQKAVRRLMLSAFGVAQALLLICDCFRIYLRFGR